MRQLGNFFSFFILSFLLISCELTKNIALNSISTTLAGSNEKGIQPKKNDKNPDSMLVLTGESDPVLMAGFFPTALKIYEVLLSQNPKHQGLAVMTGSLYIMYANAFIQQQAEMLPIERFTEKNAELIRAKKHYLRGREYELTVLNQRYAGFSQKILSGNEKLTDEAIAKITAKDVDAAYWAGAGWLGAFSLEPLDPSLLSNITAAVALLEKAAELNPDYSNGAIWNVLFAYYASAPEELGGGREKAIFAYNETIRVSKGKSIGPYITYATAIAIPDQNIEEFDTAIEKALKINPDENPETRLAETLAKEKALWLKEHKEDFFLIWE